MAHPRGETSNRQLEANALYDALEDWNKQLRHHDFQFEKPFP
jgi:hypothetical protein